jgi:hypothetical protein
VADDPGEGIYRAMVEENGMPRLGASAETLGIRRDKDIVPDQFGLVHRPNFQPGETNGLSCAPTIQDLPAFVRPRSWGGRNKRTVAWQIEAADLGPGLAAQEDSDPGRATRHVSIGPAQTMAFDDYVKLIEATQANWKKVIKN